MPRPILYSFRRCPYAMRARLALSAKSVEVELREVILRDKPSDMLKASSKGTVPVLMLPDGTILEESLDVMLWAAKQPSDNPDVPKMNEPSNEMMCLISQIDGPFKHNLDRYKYANRYEGGDGVMERDACSSVLQGLNDRLSRQDYLFGAHITFADYAIAPFIRQFANTDKIWFYATPYNYLQNWLDEFCDSRSFNSIMNKYPQWHKGDEKTIFPEMA